MKEQLKVSVIIPVYGVENYIEECVESVLLQSYKNMEIILVDDGSKDSSGIICDQYAYQDSRVIVIHKENGGLSDARNIGILKSTGDYVLFLDGDDFWNDTRAVEQLVNRISITGASCFNFFVYKNIMKIQWKKFHILVIK
ncbi:putative capsular polysaccharide biosynthesis protein,Glycosyl Transferase Family 2, YveT [Lachnospiraceae bacterium TWA4]|nr:putative capsular polysaccharide biosynthesis protein,Glycosyl Transferase Family 2, YveT [Lachnospiraceae bacterium TWA4]